MFFKNKNIFICTQTLKLTVFVKANPVTQVIVRKEMDQTHIYWKHLVSV